MCEADKIIDGKFVCGMDSEPFDLEKAKKEVKQKIAAGILPEGAEIAICDQPNCNHWAHKLEPVKSTAKDEEGN